MNNPAALDALMKIEGFRSLNQDIETIINKSEKVKKAKKDQENLTKKEKKELSEEEKEYKSLRKQIQEKLIKFATRVPIFMYLTDYRERTLKDVITQLEPGLFKKVTGLDVKDFEMLCTIGVFNASLMNDAIFKFKRYEDASLSYTGIDKHEGKDVGGWDTVIKREEYQKLFYNQQATMEYKMPVSQPSYVSEEPATYGTKKEEQPVTPVRSETKATPIAGGTKPQPRSITNQYGKPQVQPSQPKKEEASAVDTKKEIERLVNLVVEGAVVKHKAFGNGTVEKMDKVKKHIRVKFEVGEKTFLFRDAFLKGYLSI